MFCIYVASACALLNVTYSKLLNTYKQRQGEHRRYPSRGLCAVFKEGIDIDLRGNGTYEDALNIAFKKSGLSKKEFHVTKWAKNRYGKSFPVEWRAKNGAEVSIDLGHSFNSKAPTIPHIGWQTGGKRGAGGGLRGHIFVDNVPYNR